MYDVYGFVLAIAVRAHLRDAKVGTERGKGPTQTFVLVVFASPGARRHPRCVVVRPTMTLWTFCQSVLLTFNAFAILNEQRFLEKSGLGQSSLTSGYVSATSPRGQLIGLITATQYMRGTLENFQYTSSWCSHHYSSIHRVIPHTRAALIVKARDEMFRSSIFSV